MRSFDGVAGAVCADVHPHAVRERLHTIDPHALANVEAAAAQATQRDRRQLGILARKGPIGVHDRHLAAETVIGLRQFQPHGARADDNEPVDFSRAVDDGFAGEERRRVQARDLGDDGRRPCRDHEPPGANAVIAGFHCRLVDKARRRRNDANAQPRERSRAVWPPRLQRRYARAPSPRRGRSQGALS